VMTGWSIGLEGWLFMGTWILALVGMVLLLVRTPTRRSDRDQALDCLRDRLARGELSPDEFERARSLLDSDIPRRNTQ
jgi:uncharacterized membrane protein